ncbi:MAG: S-adenosylmethionine:tRNA ribosyltransferase-isomerase, partial [Oscillospiraceae bacterium]
MKTADFFYDLPQELIAQTPLEPRDSSRLMELNRQTGEISHKHFYDIINYLDAGDVLVINNSRVLPARLYGKRVDKNTDVELLLLEQKD